MIFTSYTYLLFLLISFCVHWLLPARFRIFFLVAASYVFYCSWRWQYGFLLLGVSLFNWAFGRWVLSDERKSHFLWVGLLVNAIPLIYFKYTGFLLHSLADLLSVTGLGQLQWFPDILLPLGISFFTFQGIAYLVDVVSGEPPFKNVWHFLLFKGFWPQLIAGPIIRHGEISDQIEQPRQHAYDDTAAGLHRILIGFLKKVVLADNLASVVEMVFLPTAQVGTLDSLIGMIGFSLQIYFDFSAYSDIAIGSARLFGYQFPENFNWPYAAASPREFWERWHMTLSSWIRDYLFTPLAFSFRRRANLLPLVVIVVMAICGLWHGAAWTFVVWGIWHGVMLLLGELTKRLTSSLMADRSAHLLRLGSWVGTLATLAGVGIGWIFFRTATLAQAWRMLGTFLPPWTLRPQVIRENAVLFVGCVLIGVVAVHLARNVRWPVSVHNSWDRVAPFIRPPAYALAIALVIIADRGSQAFVYFQF